jgi:hypothetical protein
LETTTIDRGVFTVARRQLQQDCSIALALIIGGGLSNADVKRRFGRVRLAMLWLHSFEEPFYSKDSVAISSKAGHFAQFPPKRGRKDSESLLSRQSNPR